MSDRSMHKGAFICGIVIGAVIATGLALRFQPPPAAELRIDDQAQLTILMLESAYSALANFVDAASLQQQIPDSTAGRGTTFCWYWPVDEAGHPQSLASLRLVWDARARVWQQTPASRIQRWSSYTAQRNADLAIVSRALTFRFICASPPSEPGDYYSWGDQAVARSIAAPVSEYYRAHGVMPASYAEAMRDRGVAPIAGRLEDLLSLYGPLELMSVPGHPGWLGVRVAGSPDVWAAMSPGGKHRIPYDLSDQPLASPNRPFPLTDFVFWDRLDPATLGPAVPAPTLAEVLAPPLAPKDWDQITRPLRIRKSFRQED